MRGKASRTVTLTLSLARTAHSSPLGLVAPTRPPTRLDGPAIDRHRSAGNAPIQPRSDVLVVSGPARSGSSPIRYRSPYSCVSREDRSGSRERGFRGICSASRLRAPFHSRSNALSRGRLARLRRRSHACVVRVAGRAHLAALTMPSSKRRTSSDFESDFESGAERERAPRSTAGGKRKVCRRRLGRR